MENLQNDNDLVTKLEQATINEGIFMEIEIHVWKGEIVATGSERGSSVDIMLWKEQVI